MKKPRIVSTSASSDAVLRTLAWVRKQGFKPVPLRPRSKAAVSRDYASPDYVPPDDEAWRRAPYELGVVLGPRQHGPVDVDLDCPETLTLAPSFLPPTDAVFGRASKPRSHYLYKVDAPDLEKRAFIDPVDNSTLIEIRGDNGHQTVMPGSLHEGTGELIEWSGVPFPEVTIVPADQLMRAVRKTALAALIARHVWAPGYHNEPCKHLSGMLYYLEWTLDEAEQLITAVMQYSGDTDKSRIPTVRATFRRGAAGKKVSGAGMLRKQLNDDRIVDRLLEWAGSPTINVIQEYNERFAVVSLEGKFRIADLDVPAGEPPLFYQKDDFLGLMATDYADERNEAGKPIPKARIWLANARRRQYRGADFLPGAEDPPFLNLWTGWAVPPAETASGCEAWLRLLRDVICGGDAVLNRWMLHWFANIVREPMSKSLTAPVIIGPEGAGKSLLIGYFGRILGKGGFTVVTHDEHIHGKFNRHLGMTLLLHSDEALYAGDKRHAGIVRSLITDEYRIFEQKGIDARQVRNFMRLILTSNEPHAAPAKPGDRRYTVTDMEERKADDALIARVLTELDGAGPAALHRHLLDMSYDPLVPRTNVKNYALIGMKAMNFTPTEAWWYERLCEGTVLPDYLAWAGDPAGDDWPEIVGSPALYASLCVRMRERSQRNVPSDTAVALQLNRFVGLMLQRGRREFSNPLSDAAPQQVQLLGDRMQAVLNMPPLDKCRAAFERYLGQVIDWPDVSRQESSDEQSGPRY